MYIWVVELQGSKKWYPTESCKLSLKAGREELNKRQDRYVANKYRLRKYVREEEV